MMSSSAAGMNELDCMLVSIPRSSVKLLRQSVDEESVKGHI